ncbi:MAG: hypothetical protein AAF847_00370 [Bacteroidota bacterium]
MQTKAQKRTTAKKQAEAVKAQRKATRDARKRSVESMSNGKKATIFSEHGHQRADVKLSTGVHTLLKVYR